MIIRNLLFPLKSSLNILLFRFFVYSYVFVLSASLIGSRVRADDVLWKPISFFIFLPMDTWHAILPFLIWILAASSILALFGVWYRASSLFCFVCFLIVVGYYLNFGKVFHGYHLMAMSLGILCFSRPLKWPLKFADRKLVFYDELGWEYGWPIQLIKIYAVSIYFSSGLKKLLMSPLGWLDGSELLIALHSNPGQPVTLQYLLDAPPFVLQLISIFVVVVVQLLSPLALINQTLAVIWFTFFLIFHVSVSVFFGGHGEFFSFVVCNLAFLPLGSWLKSTYSFLPNFMQIKKKS